MHKLEELLELVGGATGKHRHQLFELVHENLRARNAANGGDEMLRLRSYEKLQNLVARGAVTKTGKKYKGSPAALALAIAQQNGNIPVAGGKLPARKATTATSK